MYKKRLDNCVPMTKLSINLYNVGPRGTIMTDQSEIKTIPIKIISIKIISIKIIPIKIIPIKFYYTLRAVMKKNPGIRDPVWHVSCGRFLWFHRQFSGSQTFCTVLTSHQKVFDSTLKTL